jgi:hypothetical protein
MKLTLKMETVQFDTFHNNYEFYIIMWRHCGWGRKKGELYVAQRIAMVFHSYPHTFRFFEKVKSFFATLFHLHRVRR